MNTEKYVVHGGVKPHHAQVGLVQDGHALDGWQGRGGVLVRAMSTVDIAVRHPQVGGAPGGPATAGGSFLRPNYVNCPNFPVRLGQSQSVIQGEGDMEPLPMVRDDEDDVSLLLKYKGPSVDDGRMDVYEAAGNMVAFSNFMVAAAHEVYGRDVKVTAEVSGFKQGSFETDLLFHIAGATATLLTIAPDLHGLLVATKESLGLYRFLKGQKPADVKHVNEKQVRVTNRDGQVTIVQAESVNITLSPAAGEAVERFVGHALNIPGVESVEVKTEKEDVQKITKDEANYYRQIDLADAVNEVTVNMALQIVQLGFRDNLKWKFYDGADTFTADIQDKEFLQRVDNGEPFRKGDTLRALVRIVQSRRPNGTLKTERSVMQVIGHDPAPKQVRLIPGS